MTEIVERDATEAAEPPSWAAFADELAVATDRYQRDRRRRLLLFGLIVVGGVLVLGALLFVGSALGAGPTGSCGGG